MILTVADSYSSDQTTRLFSEWRRGSQKSWHEFSRPQIHGYDLNCIDVFGKTSFVSGADEKLLRVFDEPRDVAKTLKQLCGIKGHQVSGMADAANMPVLGLSNKAIDSGDQVSPDGNSDEGSDIHTPNGKASNNEQTEPPLEDQLSRHTLWPESEKLYGHGYEISSVAASHDGSLIATACRASSIDHAVIRVFKVKDWLEVKPPLKAHSLTITRIRFSQDDNDLLSVGRDRQWAVFKRDQDESTAYKFFASNPKSHSRMILDASWAPEIPEGKRIFASAGRDKVVKLWEACADGFENKSTLPESQAVTAVDFCPELINCALALAIGLEDGRIRVSLLRITDLSEQGSYSFESQ
jgi:elongator complex protein 2